LDKAIVNIILSWKIFVIVQVVFFCIVLAIVVRRRRKDNPHAWSSSLFTIPLMLMAIPPVMSEILPPAYTGLLLTWSIFWIAIFTVRTVSRHAKNKKQGGDPTHLKAAGVADDLASKNEALRKLFHLSGFLIVLAYYVVIPAVTPLLNGLEELDYLESTADASAALTLFALLCGVVVSMYMDTQRILFGEEYGIRHANAILREKEIRSPGAQSYLLVSSAAAWITGMLFRPVAGEMAMIIPLVSIVMATFADGMAAIIGKAKGKHKVKRPFNQIKSVEGFIAGFVTALVVAFAFFNQFEGGWIIAIIASAVFLVIDYVSLPIADNALNPIIVTLVAELLAIAV
jgi:dolichol kinase/uncharacterized membrane protein YhaH (DUF805 family)